MTVSKESTFNLLERFPGKQIIPGLEAVDAVQAPWDVRDGNEAMASEMVGLRDTLW